ncbi:MAG: hypothetical protein R3E12_07625 [Candidatus Eisenbacteria bacterium]
MAGPHRCETCGLLFLEPGSVCPQCSEPEEDDIAVRPTEWIRAWECVDEVQALTLQAELARHDIPSWIRSLELPGYQGLIHTRPVWGWLLVDREDLPASQVCIEEFLDTVEGETR